MRMNNQALIRRLAELTILGASVLPACVYLWVSLATISSELEMEAEIQARAVSNVISKNPDSWMYATERLKDAVEVTRHTHTLATLLDTTGKVLQQVGEDDRSPLRVYRRAAFLNYGEAAGSVIVSQSFHLILAKVILLLIFCSIIGYAFWRWLHQEVFQQLDRAQAEIEKTLDDLSRSEELFRSLSENTSAMVWTAGLDKKCTWFNKVWLDFTGRTLKQEQGDGWAEGVHPDDLEHCLNTYITAFDKMQNFSMIYRMRRHDGEFRYVLDHGAPHYNDKGKFIGYIGTCVDVTDRKLQEQRLLLTQYAMDHASIQVFWIKKSGQIAYVNSLACASLGYSSDELCSLRIPDIDPFFPEQHWDAHWQQLSTAGPQFLETKHRRKDGGIIDVEVSANYVRFGDQEFNIAYIRDITARNKQNEQLHLAQFAMEHSPVEIYWLDKDARIQYVNKYACDTLGYTREELKALSIPELDPLFPVDEWQAHWEGLKQGGPQHFETQHRRKDGSVIPVEVSANYVKFGQHEYNVAFSHDLTERKKHEGMVMQLAFHDALTKLPNRRLLNERLSLAMASSKRSQCYGALLFLDLDNFKPLNDQYGHNVGDLLLVEVASRLSKCVREVDTIARFGGDEFVIVVGDLKESLTESREQANKVAEKILDCLALPYLLSVRKADGSKGNIAHSCTASIGVKLFLDDQETTEIIINQADAAMYQSKVRGRGQISFSEK